MHKLRAFVLVSGFLFAFDAQAHDQWADGSAVPAWVKSSCCGPSDAHRLKDDQVVEGADSYIVTDGGHVFTVPKRIVLPSQDGRYWIFYNPALSDPNIYCFFVPMGS